MTTTWAAPRGDVLQKALDEIAKQTSNAKLRDNFLFWKAYSTDTGWYGTRQPRNRWSRDAQGNLVREKMRQRRREWIESHVYIRGKSGKLVALVLNPAQRKLEAQIIRMERAGIPVRICALKARQVGYSTYSSAIMLWLALHESQTSCLLIADTQKRAKELLRISSTMRKNIPHLIDNAKKWNFELTSEATYSTAWGEPFSSEIDISSSETDGAGRGGTRRIVVMDEKALWSNPHDVMAALGPSMPLVPGNYGITISTANGDFGLFRDEFMAAWKKRHMTLPERLSLAETCTLAIFVAWYEQPEYRWTAMNGRAELPAELAAEITRTLDDEERMLLDQRYFQRGVGWRNVDLDQIAWWRAILHSDVCHGDPNLRRQEYAYSPETAFLSSGRRTFNVSALMGYAQRAQPPIWTGSIGPALKGEPGRSRLTPDLRGWLTVWKQPEPGRIYVIGSDAAGGSEKGDFAAAVVGDAQTCEPVAVARVRMGGDPWGEACAYLGWYYNDAILAFETYPSFFGLAACRAAIKLGYERIFTRHNDNVATQDPTELLGFRTQVDTKPLLINRIESHLVAGNPLLCAALIEELRAQYNDPKTGKMCSGGYDDMVIAFGIMLYVRDLVWTEGDLRPVPEVETTESDRFWARRHKALGQKRQPPRYTP